MNGLAINICKMVQGSLHPPHIREVGVGGCRPGCRTGQVEVRISCTEMYRIGERGLNLLDSNTGKGALLQGPTTRFSGQEVQPEWLARWVIVGNNSNV